MSRSSRESGFTLLEVLIAAVLIGSVFVAVVSVMSQSLRNIDRMHPHELAMLHAREKMNQELMRDELTPEHSEGRWDDGYRWNVEIEPYDFVALGKTTAKVSPVMMNDKNPTVMPGVKTLFKIRLSIGWGDANQPHSYSVETMQWAMWPVPKQR